MIKKKKKKTTSHGGRLATVAVAASIVAAAVDFGGREEGKSAKTRVFSFINHHLSLFRFRARALSRVSTRMHEADARLRGGLTEIHLHSFSFSWRYRLVGCRRFVSFVVSEVIRFSYPLVPMRPRPAATAVTKFRTEIFGKAMTDLGGFRDGVGRDGKLIMKTG